MLMIICKVFILFPMFLFFLVSFAESVDQAPNFSNLGSIWQPKFEEAGLNPDLRLNQKSPIFNVSQKDVSLWATTNHWNFLTNQRIKKLEIENKVLDMIEQAQTRVVMSVFLFDNMFAESPSKFDITGKITRLLVSKLRSIPDFKVALILDPLHRAYSRRTSKALGELQDWGADVFYSDLLEQLKPATKFGIAERVRETFGTLDGVLGGGVSGAAESLIFSQPLAFRDHLIEGGGLDAHPLSLEMAKEALLLKANHRKIFFIQSGTEYEVLISSANPHSGSGDASNYGISLKGEGALWVYNHLRQDMGRSAYLHFNRFLNADSKPQYASFSRQSKSLYDYDHLLVKMGGGFFTSYFQKHFPYISQSTQSTHSASIDKSVQVQYLSEVKIKNSILEILKNTQPQDEVRVQMFYLSEPDVVRALLDVASQLDRVRPVRILLDPSKDAFNSIKDGTPNRQVAYHLIAHAPGRVLIKWASTHGEQNHAKILSVTGQDKQILLTGSANWTGKNLNNINMESNFLVRDSMALNQKFNTEFDQTWGNSQINQGIRSSLDYGAFNFENTYYMNTGKDIYDSWTSAQQAEFLKSIKYNQLQTELLNEIPALFVYGIRSQYSEWFASKIQNDRS